MKFKQIRYFSAYVMTWGQFKNFGKFRNFSLVTDIFFNWYGRGEVDLMPVWENLNSFITTNRVNAIKKFAKNLWNCTHKSVKSVKIQGA